MYHLFYEAVIIATSKDIFTFIMSSCNFRGAFILGFDTIICLYIPLHVAFSINMIKG